MRYKTLVSHVESYASAASLLESGEQRYKINQIKIKEINKQTNKKQNKNTKNLKNLTNQKQQRNKQTNKIKQISKQTNKQTNKNNPPKKKQKKTRINKYAGATRSASV